MVVFLCFHVIKLRERQKNESYAERCVAGGFVGGFIQRRHGVADTLGAGGNDANTTRSSRIFDSLRKVFSKVSPLGKNRSANEIDAAVTSAIGAAGVNAIAAPITGPACNKPCVNLGIRSLVLFGNVSLNTAWRFCKNANAKAPSPRYHQHLKSDMTSDLTSAFSSSPRIRLTVLLLPDPQGPLRAIVVPIGDCIDLILFASNSANGSIPYWSSTEVSIGLSLKFLVNILSNPFYYGLNRSRYRVLRPPFS